MKMMNLALATTLVTGAIFGACIESAEAGITRTGYKANGGSQRFLTINIQNFNLFLTTPTGEIQTEDVNTLDNESEGLFINAIENFTATVTDEANATDDEGNQIPVFDFLSINKATLDLKAILIDEDKNDNSPRIEYILSGTGNILDKNNQAQVGITELAFIIDETFDDNPFDFIDSLGQDARKNAVNSLEFIIKNNLLQKVNKIRLVGRTSKLDDENDNEREDFSLNVQAISTTIPESNFTNGILALGAFGVISGLRNKNNSRKDNQKR